MVGILGEKIESCIIPFDVIKMKFIIQMNISEVSGS